MEKTQQQEIAIEGINALVELSKEYFCKGIPDTTEKIKYISSFVSIYTWHMERWADEIFQDAVKRLQFNNLYLAVDQLVIGYWEWVHSYYEDSIVTKAIDTLGRAKSFNLLENNIYAQGACTCDSVEEWFWKTFYNITRKRTGILSALRLIKGANQHPDSKAVFNYGQFKPFMGFLEDYGLDGIRTPDVDEDIIKILQQDSMRGVREKYPQNYPRNFHKLPEALNKDDHRYNYERVNKDHDKVSRFSEKYFLELINKNSIEALKQLYEGSLRAFAKKRTNDRVTNVLTNKRLQKNGGPSLKELGKDIRQRREGLNLTQAGLATETGLAVKTIDAIEGGQRSRLAETTLVKIAGALEVDVAKLLKAPIIISLDRQKFVEPLSQDDEDMIEEFQFGHDGELDTFFDKITFEEVMLERFPPLSDHHRVVDVIFGGDFTTSKRHRGKKRLVTHSRVAHKAKVTPKRYRKILSDIKAEIIKLDLSEDF